MNQGVLMDMEWEQFLEKERNCDYFEKLCSFLEIEYEKKVIYPKKIDIYRALELTPLSKIKCVIIGQDPYFNPDEATGLAFSVNEDIKIPPSLKNIYKELNDDLGIIRYNGDLTDWAKEGVFLLNRVLTVEAGKPNSHKKIGWLKFTMEIIKRISKIERPLVFMLWGGEAIKLKRFIDNRHLVLTAPHPSPLSSYRGFFGCKHFSRCNIFLESKGLSGVKWG